MLGGSLPAGLLPEEPSAPWLLPRPEGHLRAVTDKPSAPGVRGPCARSCPADAGHGRSSLQLCLRQRRSGVPFPCAVPGASVYLECQAEKTIQSRSF